MNCRHVGSALALALAASASWAPATLAQTGCSNAAIRSPFRGEILQGTVPVLGSARIDDFSFYKVEWAPEDDPENWRAVSTTKPDYVVNSLLDQWDTTTVPDGPYRIKLTVVDSKAQEVCRITVSRLVVANRSTPTPASTPTRVARATRVELTGEGANAAAGGGQPASRQGAGAEAGAEAAAEAVATATLQPILPASAPEESADLLDPSSWLDMLRAGEWFIAFVRGFLTGWVIAVAALALYYGRRRR